MIQRFLRPELSVEDMETDKIAARRRDETVVLSSWFILFLGVLWITLGLFLNAPQLILVTIMPMAGSVLAIWTAPTPFNLLGRLLWMLSGVVSATLACFVIHDAANVEYLYAAMVGGPFLVFSILSERAYILFFVAASLLLFAITSVVPADALGTMAIGEETARTFIRVPIGITSLTIVMIEFAFFSFIANDYSRRILRASSQARNAIATKSEMMAGMSHEIRTPMNGVIGMIEIMDKTDLTADQRRNLGTIKESANSLLRIVDDIIDTARIEAGQLELREEEFDLLNTLENVAQSLSVLAYRGKVKLTIYIDPSIPKTVIGDPLRLRQIVLNILANAIKFSTKDDNSIGHVDMSVQLDDLRRLKVAISDDGIGMDEDMIARLFKPFSRSADGANSKYAGSGLGLSIVHNLVKKMDGDIEVTSRPGAGSRFTVYVPLKAVEARSDVPQYAGTRAVVFVTYHRLNFRIRTYLETMGIECILCSDEKSFVQALSSAQQPVIGVIGIAGDMRAATEAVFERARREFVDVPFVNMITDRSRAFGFVEDRAVTVHCSPLLPSAFWEGGELLLAEPNEYQDDHDNTEAKTAPAPERVLNLLVAEDNEINKYVILSQVEQLGHKCTVVSNGKYALEYWETGAFDMILTDCNMPVLDGYELAEKIRQEEFAHGRTRTPIIAITASALPGEAEKCYEAGMDDYLTKPVQLKSLSSVLQRWSK